MEKKLAIYICEGCRIAKAIDTAALCSKMQNELKPAFCRTHAALCSMAGVQMIRNDLKQEELNGCLFAACGEGTKDESFRLEGGLQTERADIRELVAWAMEPKEDNTAMAAEDYIRMGYAGLKQMPEAKPFILDGISEDILVVGGGVAGLKASLDGAEAGYSVHLLEKAGVLGGRALQWHQQIPFDRPFSELRDPVVRKLVKQVENQKKIQVHLNTAIEKIDGQPGAFEVKLAGEVGEQLKVGSIVTASGWKPYKPEGGSFFGLGELPGVMTSVELEAEVREGELPPLDSLLFVQCAGSRDVKHLPYCSSVCCGVTLKQAKYIRDRFPDAVIYIVYKDIRTTGFLEDFYKEMQSDPHIVLIKGNVKEVVAGNECLEVMISDRLLGEELRVSVDHVVLATGMVPNESTDLKLGYRLGQGIPELKYSFPDSHFICFPYETRRTGIYLAGGIRAPMDIPSAMEDGSGAMMKAIQMIESAKRGEAVHPRSGDQSFPELYIERCTDCKRCTEECPFGTYDETASGTPVVHPNRCRRCGICVGSCPERVIGFTGFTINLLSEKIKAVEVPDEFEEKPRVLLFVCENDALPALRMAVRKGLKINPCVRIVPVRCLGSINRVWVSDALSKGFDGILQIGCKPGDDYQCHFIHGSDLTGQRSDIYEETLASMMLETERIRTKYVEITDYKGIIEHIDNYMEEIEQIGPNPFKGM